VSPPAPPAEGRRAHDHRLPALTRRYGEALRVGDGAAAEQVIADALPLDLSPVAVQSLIIAPAMTRIGELWERGDVSVADEHLATAISERALVRLFEALRVAPPASRERVLLAAVEGQHHVMGLRMVADVLEGAGFDVKYLGANVPVSSLRRFIFEHEPAITGLAFGMAANVGCLADSISAAHRASPHTRILLGGRAVPQALREVGYPYVESSLRVFDAVERLLAGPPQTLAPIVETLRSIPGAAAPVGEAAAAEDSVAARLADAAQDANDVARDYVRLAGSYKDLALTDPLTNLPNRRAFERRMDELGDGTLLMIDIDEFKAVNDRYGHPVGDSLLQSVGQAITKSLRPHDFAARIGGDEFAVVLSPAEPVTAREISQRIRRAVIDDVEPAVSLSIGVAPMYADRRAAMLASDTALYEAKEGGRDRIVEAASGV
jgi:diguanylate cyclase (GGDEF)-like protein